MDDRPCNYTGCQQLADYDVELPESAFYLCRRHTAELVANRDSAVQAVRLLESADRL